MVVSLIVSVRRPFGTGRGGKVTRMHVGQTARRTRRVTSRDIELFTEMTGDRNPDYDEALAGSRFGGIIVQGG